MTNATLLFIIIMNKYGLRTVILKELEMIRKIKGFFSSIGKPKALLALAILLCTAGVIALFVYDSVQNKNEAQTRAEFEERIRDLSVEKLELTAELDALDRAVVDALGGGGCMPMVVYGTHTDAYEYLFPLFPGTDKEGAGEGVLPATGIIALSPTELPDLEGRMTFEQFNEMIDAGWQAIVYWGGEEALDGYLEVMEANFETLGLPKPEAVLFRSTTYSTELDGLLKARGYKYIFHCGEEYLPYIETSVRQEGDIWHIGSVGWNTYGVSSAMLTNLLSSSGVMAFTVDFNYGTSGYDGSNIACRASFERMVERLDAFRNSKDLYICSLGTLEAVRSKYVSDAEAVLGENAVRREQIRARVMDIEREISAIYEEYKG